MLLVFAGSISAIFAFAPPYFRSSEERLKDALQSLGLGVIEIDGAILAQISSRGVTEEVATTLRELVAVHGFAVRVFLREIDDIDRLQLLDGLGQLEVEFQGDCHAFFEQLPNLRGLNSLDLTVLNEETLSLERIPDLPDLKKLRIVAGEISGTTINRLIAKYALTALTLKVVSFDDNTFLLDTANSQLTTVCIFAANMSAEVLLNLADFNSLESVRLMRCPRYDPKGFAKLVANTRLEYFSYFGDCAPYRDECWEKPLDHAFAQSNMRGLALIHCKFGDVGLKSLYKNKRLEQLMLLGTNVSSSAIAEFRAARPNCEVIYAKDAGDDNLFQLCICSFQQAWESYKRLRELERSSTSIRRE